MANTFTDDRGKIKDLFVNDDYAITRVTFKKGAIRGNHYHKETIQVDFILDGELIFKTDKTEEKVSRGSVLSTPQGTPHAYKALTDASLLTICFGVRKGEDYSKDTYKKKIL